MGYNKLQRKITAYVYGRKRINNMAVSVYKNYSEIKYILNKGNKSNARK